jgi:hypothetical protein
LDGLSNQALERSLAICVAVGFLAMKHLPDGPDFARCHRCLLHIGFAQKGNAGWQKFGLPLSCLIPSLPGRC